MHDQAPTVFVSYSHRDAKRIEQLRRFLDPLQRDGLIDYWDDTRIKPGADWEKEIDQALARARVAVLLISQDFINSKFIYEKEVPRILAARDAGRLTVLPVFLSPSTADFSRYPYTDPRTNEPREVNLASIQGYGSPEKGMTLRELKYAERERLWRQLAAQLKESVGTPASVPVAAPVIGRSITALDAQSRHYELSVQLVREGDQLVASYALPGTEPFRQYSRPWSEAADQVSDISKTLNGDDRDATAGMIRAAASRHGGIGGILFRLLFGPEDFKEKAFRTAFHRQQGAVPNPSFAPLLLQVLTAIQSCLACLGASRRGRSGPWWSRAGCSRPATTNPLPIVPHPLAATCSSWPPKHPRQIRSTTAPSWTCCGKCGRAGPWRMCVSCGPDARWRTR